MAPVSRARSGATLRAASEASADRKSGKTDPFAHLYARESAPLDDVDAANAWDSIAYALRAGNAVTLSVTADGGALKLTLWQDGRKYIGYGADARTIDELFAAIGPQPVAADAGKGT